MQPITVNTVEHWPLQRLIPYARNARTHDERQVSQIAASMVEFGFVNPILVGEEGVIVAGHGRLMAAQQLQMETVPVIVLGHLSETQRRALVIADNKLAEQAGWSEELLALELGELQDLGFDLDLIGFSDEELEGLLELEDKPGQTDEDQVPKPEENVISQRGDLWLLGDHKLLCGDATQLDDVKTLLGDELADMAITDPPYNVDYSGGNREQMRGKERVILNDKLGDDFYDFLKSSVNNLLHVTKGACYISMSSSELTTLQKAFQEAGGRWSTFIIWAKNHFTLGSSDYQRQYEPILYGWKEGHDHFWCGDRNQSDVWFVNKPQKNDLHPTMKPVELIERAIKNSSKSRDLVLDAFGGFGTTLIACEKTGRRARLLELDPKYVDVIIRRWQDYTGEEAIRYVDHECFDHLATSNRKQ